MLHFFGYSTSPERPSQAPENELVEALPLFDEIEDQESPLTPIPLAAKMFEEAENDYEYQEVATCKAKVLDEFKAVVGAKEAIIADAKAQAARRNKEEFYADAALDVFSYIDQLDGKMDDIRATLGAAGSMEEIEKAVEQFATLAATNRTESGDATLIQKRTEQILAKINKTQTALETQSIQKEGVTQRITNIAIYYAAIGLAGLSEDKISFAFSGSRTKPNIFDPNNPDGFIDALKAALKKEKLSIKSQLMVAKLLPAFIEFIQEGIHQHIGSIFAYADQLIDAMAHSDDSVQESAKVLGLVKNFLIDLIPEFKGIFDDDGPLTHQTAQLHAATLVLSEFAPADAVAQMRENYTAADSDAARRDVLSIACNAEGKSNSMTRIDALTQSLMVTTSQDETRLATERAFAKISPASTVINPDDFLTQAAIQLDGPGFEGAMKSTLNTLKSRKLINSTVARDGESVEAFLERIARKVETTVDQNALTLDARVRSRVHHLTRTIVNEQIKTSVQAGQSEEELEKNLLNFQVELALNHFDLDKEEFNTTRAQELRLHKQYKMRVEAMTHNIDETRQVELMGQARLNANQQIYCHDSYDAMIDHLVDQEILDAAQDGFDISSFRSIIEQNQRGRHPPASEVVMDRAINAAYHQLFSDEVLAQRGKTYTKLLEGVCERFVKRKVTFMTPPLEQMRKLWTFNSRDNPVVIAFKFIGKLIASIFYGLYYATFLNKGIDLAINEVIEYIVKNELVLDLGSLITNIEGSISHGGNKKAIFGTLNGLLNAKSLSVVGDGSAVEEYDFTPGADLESAKEGDEDVGILRGIIENFMSLAAPQGRLNEYRHTLVTSVALGASTTIADGIRRALKDGLSLKQHKTSVLSAVNGVLDNFNNEAVSDTALDRVEGVKEEREFYASAKEIAKKVASDSIRTVIESAPQATEDEGWMASATRCAASAASYIADSRVGQTLSSVAADMTMGAVAGDYVERVVENSVGFVFNETTLEGVIERGIQKFSAHLEDENTQTRLAHQRAEAERFASRKKARRFKPVAMGPFGGMMLVEVQ